MTNKQIQIIGRHKCILTPTANDDQHSTTKKEEKKVYTFDWQIHSKPDLQSNAEWEWASVRERDQFKYDIVIDEHSFAGKIEFCFHIQIDFMWILRAVKTEKIHLHLLWAFSVRQCPNRMQISFRNDFPFVVKLNLWTNNSKFFHFFWVCMSSIACICIHQIVTLLLNVYSVRRHELVGWWPELICVECRPHYFLSNHWVSYLK